jgi:iron complex outermembrane receptor protein
VTLETATSYMHSDAKQNVDADASNIRLGDLPTQRWASGASQEIRLLSNGGGRLNWIVGAYAFMLDTHNISAPGNATFGPAPAFPITGYTVNATEGWNKTRSYAGFAEGTYELVANLFLTLGGRYTTEKKSQITNLSVNGVPKLIPSDSTRFNKFTYNGSLRYQFTEKSNVYVRYGTGFKSGIYTGTLQPVMTRPEEIKALEGGIKSDPVDWLRMNLSAFHYDYTDLQVTARDPLTTSYIVQNAANAELYGGELEMTLVPVSSFTLRGSVAYNHARYKSFPNAQGFSPNVRGGNNVVTADVSGNHMLRAPSWTFNISPTFETELGGGRFGATANLFHSSRLYYDFLNALSQAPYTMLSGELSWTAGDDGWRFSVWGQNLLNSEVVQNIRPGTLSTDAIYEPPRRFGIGLSRRF